MAKEVQCETHGTRRETFVCTHLLGEAVGLGFNRIEPSADAPFPDAWCDDCELIRAAHSQWNERSQELVKISVLCSDCYERARIRNTRTSITLDDLAELRWKCSHCDDWHYGPCLDFAYSAPYYWRNEYGEASGHEGFLPGSSKNHTKTFLNEDYCQIDDDCFVRGLIHLPIIGTAKVFCWGVWGSLSRANFQDLIAKKDGPEKVALPAMFSWLSSQISEYPDTLNLKMYARIQGPGQRPDFELEPSDHPLFKEYHGGITPKRVKEIMLGRLRAPDQQR
jgi:hypothetical protein